MFIRSSTTGILMLALALPACGGDDNGDGGSKPAATQPPAEESAVSIPKNTDCANEPAARTLELVVATPGKLKFDRDCARVKAGRVNVRIRNDESVPHNVRIEKSERCCAGAGAKDLGGTGTITDKERTARGKARLEPGEYWFFCSVGGHWQRGMGGTLIVE